MWQVEFIGRIKGIVNGKTGQIMKCNKRGAHYGLIWFEMERTGAELYEARLYGNDVTRLQMSLNVFRDIGWIEMDMFSVK